MAGLLAVLAGISLMGMRHEPAKREFMSLGDSNFLRGLWSIVVVLVHVPVMYQNPIQDMLGSFAYIGVTFFFMTSAFGLKYSMTHKKGYLERFWMKRLPAIVVPAFMAHALAGVTEAMQGHSVTVFSFVGLGRWVQVLLCYYVFFWLVHRVGARWIPSEKRRDAVLCLCVVALSLGERLLGANRFWAVESLGFAYGIVAANKQETLARWFGKKWGWKSLALASAGVGLGLAYLKCKPVAFWGDYLLKIALGMALLALMFALIGKLRVGNAVSRFLGDISYEIYLLHGVAFGVLVCCRPRFEMNSGTFIWLALCLTVLGSVLVDKASRSLIGFWKAKMRLTK